MKKQFEISSIIFTIILSFCVSCTPKKLIGSYAKQINKIFTQAGPVAFSGCEAMDGSLIFIMNPNDDLSKEIIKQETDYSRNKIMETFFVTLFSNNENLRQLLDLIVYESGYVKATLAIPNSSLSYNYSIYGYNLKNMLKY